MFVTRISENKSTRIKLLQHVASSCLFLSHFAIPRGHLHMRITSFYAIVEEHASSAHETLAYTIGTTSKHQRVTWPELYRKLIVFIRIVVWHMSVCSLATCLRCCDVVKNAAKNVFLIQILKIHFQIIVTANRWWCNMHVILS